MAISIVRKETDEDIQRVKQAAQRFIRRENIRAVEGIEAEDLIEYEIETTHPEEAEQLRKRWQRAFCRALRMPNRADVTTGYGYVGYDVD